MKQHELSYDRYTRCSFASILNRRGRKKTLTVALAAGLNAIEMRLHQDNMYRLYSILFLLTVFLQTYAQKTIGTFTFGSDVTITVDAPKNLNTSRPLWLIWYALPNGNTTAQTMGKKLKPGDDWHFGIQHIGAQAAFVRHMVKNTDIVVLYAENSDRSWPAWKARHTDHAAVVKRLIDTVSALFAHAEKQIHLNGHSGGGRFIFSYLDAVSDIPAAVKRISFLDSNYGYDSSYLPKFANWLQTYPGSYLTVFAYNDSIALYEGKPFVSATGGTWYRSHLMLHDLRASFSFREHNTDSMLHYFTTDRRVQFYLKTNPGRAIFHTVQVERNGFIHALLSGTRYDSQKYHYYGKPAYRHFIVE